MNYSSLSDILSTLSESEIARLTDDAQGKTVNQDIVNEAITKGDEFLNGYLRSRYSLPLSTVPALVKDISVELAIYNLFLRRYRTKMPESADSQYKATIKTLEQIQKGFINLGIEPKAQEGGQVGTFRTNKTSSDRLFSKDLLNGF